MIFTVRQVLSSIFLLAWAVTAAAQPPTTCPEEVERLRYLVQHFQSGRTAAEFEVARLQALSRALQREVERLRQVEKSAPRQSPGGPK